MAIDYLYSKEKLIIPFDRTISFVITENCSFQCAHCLRGDRRPNVISKEVINAVLSQIEIHGRLFLAGGEPLLHIEKIIYLLDQLYSLGNTPKSISFFTNGSVCASKFEEFVAISSQKGAVLRIKVSNDFYHRQERKRLFGYEDDLTEMWEIRKRVEEYRAIMRDYGYTADNESLFLERYKPCAGPWLSFVGKGQSMATEEVVDGREFSIYRNAGIICNEIIGDIQILPDGRISSCIDMTWEESDKYGSNFSVLENPIARILKPPNIKYNC
ncbi:MAG TPA: hypothetical protein PLX66_02625 [Bacilli bacterium]|nr:hypothetical protein [Bacilli bacterium]